MRAAARTGRFGLLLVSLLILLGTTTGVAQGTAGATHPAPFNGWSVSDEPSMHDDRHDWLRQAAARHVPATAHPDTWWVLCRRATARCALRGRSPADAAGSARPPVAVSTPPSTRAPPPRGPVVPHPSRSRRA
ncbi:hypothetical protein [Saccharothrix longispora]|uniref:hypothetical protein n=1 Tax=Saccharothrix longispora TaxID=33920 RepID=UPI0028FD7B30|nr:hypothetical protein [Saccharothrix longispora]MDU0294711.1 hypothetical protein [Saccharothrix longispora]